MKYKKKINRALRRRLACGAAAGVLAGTALPAAAFSFDLGDGFKGAFDSTVSYGMQMRMQGRSCALISQDNGGCAGLGAELPEASQDAYFLNADNGDLNYNKYDLVSEVVKGTHELQLKMPWDLSFFGRVSELYDWRIGQTERTPLLPEARRFSVYNFQPLDAYLNKEFEWFGRNARLRVGEQVMSWGEDIFVLAGINSTNAYDIRRYHVAGAQVKEILRPAPMISLNTDLLDRWGMEAYYQWKWNGFQLDPTGTYFSSADPAGKGNDAAIFIPTSSLNAGVAANPAGAALLQAGLIRMAPAGTAGDPGGTRLTRQQLLAGQATQDCLTSPGAIQQRLINGYAIPGNPVSLAAATTLVCAALNTGTAIPLVSDKGGSNHGQYGLNLRYRPEWADISFGFYYERLNSKIPFITYTVDSAYAANNPLSAGYKIEYPSGINLYGVSYNTNLGDWALGGEVSWRPRDAVAIDPSVPTGANPASRPYACLQDATAATGQTPQTGEQHGKYCRGWVDRAKIQAQQTFLQVFSPTEGFGGWMLTTLGAKEGYFLGEIGATDYPGVDRLGGVPWSLPAYTLPNKFSAGYTFETQVTYPNVMNLGFDWLPQIDWTHGVIGTSPNALPWQANTKSGTFTLNFNRHNIITAALAYSWFWGGGPGNQTSDRDYLGFTVAYNF
jgi:hypothetical protein